MPPGYNTACLSLSLSSNGLQTIPQCHWQPSTQITFFLPTPAPAFILAEWPCGWLMQYRRLRALNPCDCHLHSFTFRVTGWDLVLSSPRIALFPNTAHFLHQSLLSLKLSHSFVSRLLSALLNLQLHEVLFSSQFSRLHFSFFVSLAVSITDSGSSL